MTARNQPAAAEFNDETLTDAESPARGRDAQTAARKICFLDFKDGQTGVAVTHGPVDPSRILITLRSGQAVLQISVEEGVGRKIAEGLADVLPTFRAVRSRIRRP